jgi:uncharacterized membrane protein YeaQ/YmgE (transglycosylase-associated protein family)
VALAADEQGRCFDMSYFIWLPTVGLAGWVSGEIAGGEGLGRIADVLLGVSGALLVRCLFEQTGFPLEDVYLLLFSIWGAAAPPAICRWLMRRRSKLAPKYDRATTS